MSLLNSPTLTTTQFSLKKRVYECYQVVKAEFDRLLPDLHRIH